MGVNWKDIWVGWGFEHYIADEGINENDYIVLLVLVVGHDGDDGIVYEQAKGEDPRQAGKRRPKKYKKCWR